MHLSPMPNWPFVFSLTSYDGKKKENLKQDTRKKPKLLRFNKQETKSGEEK